MTSGENTCLSLEEILILTGEMEHMEELLRHCAREKSGLGPQEMIDTVIHPILDELEDHIRSEVSVPKDPESLKSVVSQWITSRLKS